MRGGGGGMHMLFGALNQANERGANGSDVIMETEIAL